MTKLKILQIGPLTPEFNARLAEAYDVHPLWTEADVAAFLANNGSAFNAVVTTARFGCNASVIDALPNLLVVCSFGVGYDAIDVASTRKRAIPVSNTPDVLNECVADLAFGLILDVTRRLSEADRFVRAGNWQRGNFPLGMQVHGKRLGIVGLGRIGKAVARRAAGFNMQIGYHNRKPDSSVDHFYAPSAVELARWANILVLTCVGGPQTQNLISTQELEALGPTGLLVNVSRGTVVDEKALVAALQNKSIGGAGLDVYLGEPHVPAELKAMPNVVLLPHIASATIETRRAMEQMVLDNLAAFFDKGGVLNAVE